MELRQAKELCEQKMNEHGVGDWKFVWSRSRRSFGTCNWTNREIALSNQLVEINSEERVLLTILHEIAHALTPNHHHDRVWRMKCLAIGGNGERCYSNRNTVVVEGKFHYICEGCGEIFKTHRRIQNLMNRRHLCGSGVRSTIKQIK